MKQWNLHVACRGYARDCSPSLCTPRRTRVVEKMWGERKERDGRQRPTVFAKVNTKAKHSIMGCEVSYGKSHCSNLLPALFSALSQRDASSREGPSESTNGGGGLERYKTNSGKFPVAEKVVRIC